MSVRILASFAAAAVVITLVTASYAIFGISSSTDASLWSDRLEGQVRGYTLDAVTPLNSFIETEYLNFSGPVCPGAPTPHLGPEQVLLSLTTTGGDPPYTYRWSFSDGGTATSPEVLLNFTRPFTANVTIADSQEHELNLSQFVPYPTFAQPACINSQSNEFLFWGSTVGVFAAIVLAFTLWRRGRRPEPSSIASPPT